MTAERRPRRTVKLPPASDVPAEAIAAFMDAIGWDEKTRKMVRSVRISGHKVEVDVAPRPDLKITVRHPVVHPEIDEL